MKRKKSDQEKRAVNSPPCLDYSQFSLGPSTLSYWYMIISGNGP